MAEQCDYPVADNAEELLAALKRKNDYILVKGGFKKELEENTQFPLTEKEQMGFNIGFRGFAGIFGEVFYQIGNLFSDKSKQQKTIESKLRKYKLTYLNDNELLLHLRQLDY
ncbi:hypothetical protein GCM10028778_21790 [Barrientosiimonas marina]|uniref:Uncharacterized protein n=1 Tax=Lentibacillus kimchii TaxID=1542911 RepID=A0ABW2USR3_9BACI